MTILTNLPGLKMKNKFYDYDERAFPYLPPDNFIRDKYQIFFEEKLNIKFPISKLIFDKLLSLILIFLITPIIILLKIIYLIEGFLCPRHKGPLIYFYNAVSEGKVFKKFKFRVIMEEYIDKNLKKENSWLAYKDEWKIEARTFTGFIIKAFYLDELPQIINIFLGDMSFVGPRPLSDIHYQRDLEQGNVTRKYLRGGLLGMGHIKKGTSEFGNPIFEYEYLDIIYRGSPIKIFMNDIIIIIKGILLMAKGQGH